MFHRKKPTHTEYKFLYFSLSFMVVPNNWIIRDKPKEVMFGNSLKSNEIIKS